jgi:hypothetical protein
MLSIPTEQRSKNHIESLINNVSQQYYQCIVLGRLFKLAVELGIMEQLHPLIDKFMSAREKYRTILLK